MLHNPKDPIFGFLLSPGNKITEQHDERFDHSPFWTTVRGWRNTLSVNLAKSSAEQFYGSIYHVVPSAEDRAVSGLLTDNGLSIHNRNLRKGPSALAATRERFQGGRASNEHHFCWDFINPKITMTRRGLRVFHAFQFYGNILFCFKWRKVPRSIPKLAGVNTYDAWFSAQELTHHR